MELRVCNNFRCGYKTNEPVRHCPKCRRPIWTINEFRVLMSLLIPLGGILVAIGLGIIILVEYKSSPGKLYWTGSKASLFFVYTLLGAIATLGFSIMGFGLSCVIFGRAKEGLFKLMFFIMMGVLVMVGAGRLIITLLNP